MRNRAMQAALDDKLAIDLKDYERVTSPDFPGKAYLIPPQSEAGLKLAGGGETDFCDSSTEEWIWSVGRRVEDDKVFASKTPCFYQLPGYNCVWLR